MVYSLKLLIKGEMSRWRTHAQTDRRNCEDRARILDPDFAILDMKKAAYSGFPKPYKVKN